MMAMLATLFVLSAQTGAYTDPRRTFAAGPKDAVLMLPPVAVCDGAVRDMVWTADGSALVVQRTTTDASVADLAAGLSGKPTDPRVAARSEPRMELVVWSAKSHRTTVVAKGGAGALAVDQMRAMPGSDRVLVGAAERTTDAEGAVRQTITVSMLATGSGTMTRLAASDEGTPYIGFDLSPTQPLGYVLGLDAQKRRAVRFFGVDGKLGNLIVLPPKSDINFNVRGLPVVWLGLEKLGTKVTLHYQRVNVAAGTLGERFDKDASARFGDDPDAEFDPSPVKGAIEAVPVSGTADGARAPSILLKVSGGKPGESGIVTTDGVQGLVSPRGDVVAYVAQGSVVVRPLARVSRAEYDAAMLAARKAIAMNSAKQVALGLAMFAADFDDVLPSQGDYDRLDPYLKDSSLRSSFTYTYPGGKLADIEKPAETEIGYVTGPGGRAVAYADGHVKWVSDAP